MPTGIVRKKDKIMEKKRTVKVIATCDNLDDILNHLLELRLSGKKENLNEYWSFRGQRNKDWNLAITPRTDSTESFNYEENLYQYQKRMLNDRTLDYMIEKNPWWWLFHAKHHRLHTRLLDWTSNPLVAIYFAVENILSAQHIPEGDLKSTDSAVYALKVNQVHFFPVEKEWTKHEDEYINPVTGEVENKINGTKREMNENEWIMVNPGHTTPRITIQSSKFTYHPGKNPTPIDLMDRRKDEELLMIIIKSSTIPKIRKQLGIMNIHHASLFPNPTGVALFLNEEWPEITK